MATYRKKLLDKDGNTIIPALAGDETGWVNTADLADGSVTVDKLAEYTANKALRTTANLEPTADTPQAWLNLFGNAGFYVTGYSANHFTNQPGNYGVLETYHGNNTIHQKFLTVGGTSYYRAGSNSGWYGAGSGASGAFRQLIDTNVSTGTITMATGFNKNGAFCKKVGNIVSWGLQLLRDNVMTGPAVTVGTIPSGFRPNNNTICYGSSTDGINLYTLVTPEGNIRVCPSAQISTTANVYIGGTYIIS